MSLILVLNPSVEQRADYYEQYARELFQRLATLEQAVNEIMRAAGSSPPYVISHDEMARIIQSHHIQTEEQP